MITDASVNLKLPSFKISNGLFDITKLKSKDYYSLLIKKKACLPKYARYSRWKSETGRRSLSITQWIFKRRDQHEAAELPFKFFCFSWNCLVPGTIRQSNHNLSSRCLGQNPPNPFFMPVLLFLISMRPMKWYLMNLTVTLHRGPNGNFCFVALIYQEKLINASLKVATLIKDALSKLKIHAPGI